MTELIHHYADYDRWANARIVERLSREPASTLDALVKSSFPSLRATLMHVRNAECAWRFRMLGQPVQWPAEPHDGLDTLMKHVELMHAHARSLSMEELASTFSYQDLKGNAYSSLRWHALMHCFNHSSYHRGQLVTMMRGLGLEEIPAMDLVVFQRSLS